MNKKTRTILFYSCVTLFLIAASLILLYFQGYMVNLNPPENGQVFTQTGGFYFKTTPQNAQAFLDGKLKKKPDFLFGDLFIKNLLPKFYSVSIQKDGYLSWEKNLEVKANLVTENKNIVLIPKNPDLKLLATGVQDFFVSPDGSKIIYKKISTEKNTSPGSKSSWYLTVFDLNKNVESSLTDDNKLAKTKADFIDLQWFPDSKKILLNVAFNEAPKYYVFDLESQSASSSVPPTPITLAVLSDAEQISFSWQEPTKIYYLSKGNIFNVDYKTKAISGSALLSSQGPFLTDVLTYTINKNNIFALTEEGFIRVADLSGKIQNQINTKPLDIKEEIGYQIIMSFPDIFIKETDTLFYYNKQKDVLEKVIDDAQQLTFSIDGKKLLIYNENEIWVRYMENILEQPTKKLGELQIVIHSLEKIGKAFWITDHYLMFNTNGNIKIAEIDDRDKTQVWDFVGLSNDKIIPKIHWDGKLKELFFFNNDSIYSSQSLLK